MQGNTHRIIEDGELFLKGKRKHRKNKRKSTSAQSKGPRTKGI